MGGVSSDSGDSLNIELNLVPFIDLLSSLVLFLLITAVWVQISAIPAGIDAKGATPIASNDDNLLTIHLDAKGHQLLWPPSTRGASLPGVVAKTETGYDLAGLTEVMKRAIAQGNQPIGAVSAEDVVDYGEVVRTIDTLKQGGLEMVALTTN